MHDVYKRLGLDQSTRSCAYQELFLNELDQKVVYDIQQASTFSIPLGNSRFQQQIEQAVNRKLGYAKLGRH